MKTFSFEDDSKVIREVSKFKGKKGVTYRFGFPLFPALLEKDDLSLEDLTPEDPEDERSCQKLAPVFVAHKCAWVDGVGQIFCDDPEVESFVLSKTTAKPKTRVGTVLYSFPLDENGNPNFKRMVADPESVIVQGFVIDLGKYKKLKEKHFDYPLWENDLKASLEADKQESFQTWSFDIPKSKYAYSVLRKLLEKKEAGDTTFDALISSLLKRARHVAKNELEQCMGKEITLQTLKEKLGFAASSSSPEVDISTDEDVEAQLADLDLGL